MKILWITNILPKKVSIFINEKIHFGGGWLEASANEIKNEIDLGIASAYGGNELKVIDFEDVRYFLIPSKNALIYEKHLESIWLDVKKRFKPDIIHIHGSEYALGLSFLKSCGNEKTVLTIQGLVSAISNYYINSMSFSDIIKNVTIRDIIKFDTIFHQKKSFFKRGLNEKKYFSTVENVIGRTFWDYSWAKSFNKKINYYTCNESLRNSFYKGSWNFDSCEQFSLFVSQGSYPIKGLHQLLKTMPFVIDAYPDAKLYVGGWSRVQPKSFKDRMMQDGYSKYLSELIIKLNLKDNVIFLGSLDEEKMKEKFLKSHIFICPSSIENSSNSVGEAQLLGVPTIASYVGGMPDMVEDKVNGFLFRYEEVKVLARLIIDIFEKKYDLKVISKNARVTANIRHNRSTNKQDLLSIYNEIMSS